MLLCCHAQMSGWQGAQELHAEGGHAVAYKGMVDCFVRTVREEGVKALFKVGPPHFPANMQDQSVSLRHCWTGMYLPTVCRCKLFDELYC